MRLLNSLLDSFKIGLILNHFFITYRFFYSIFMAVDYQHILSLFEASAATSREAWANRISQEMPGKAARILAVTSHEGLDFLPLYTREDLPESMPSALRRQPSWEYHQQIYLADLTPTQANTRLLESLQSGVSGADFQFTGYNPDQTPDYGILLDQVELPFISSSFHIEAAHYAHFDAFLAYIQHGSPLQSTLYLMSDGPDALESNTRYLGRLISESKLAGFRYLGVSGLPWNIAGATAVQELAFTLSLLVHHLDWLTDLGLSIAELWQQVETELATDSHYFINIAKFRAVRILLSRLASAYQTPLAPDTWIVRATATTWNKTLYDPVSNMLRNTSEAMGAVVGGCNILSLLPHDEAYEQADGFGQRMAHNVSNILAHEAHLAKVADPAAGSYYVENLTHQLVTKAWETFVSLEKTGGFAEAFSTIQQTLKDSRLLRQQQTNSRKKVLVGATRYVNPQESISLKQLKDRQLQKDTPWEALRLRVDQHTQESNAKPTVGLLVYYPPQHAWVVDARVAFITDLLASVGLGVKEFLLTDEQSLAQTLETHEVLIVCSSPEFYNNTLPDLWQQQPMLQNKNVWLAGKPTEAPQATAWAGLKGFIYAGADIYQILTDMLKQLNL